MSEKHRKKFAVLLFVLVLAFVGAEVAILFTSKHSHDVARARADAEEISVELGMISSSFYSGDRALYDRSYQRFNESLSGFSRNVYVKQNHNETYEAIENYRAMLEEKSESIAEFLELSAALNTLSSEIDLINPEKLDAANFYQIQQAFQALRDCLAKTESEEFAPIKKKLDSFADEIIKLAQSSATCIAVCPKESFSDKSKKLAELKTKYQKEFEGLGTDVSQTYDPSALIVRLGEI
jgi:hypothetical protein